MTCSRRRWVNESIYSVCIEGALRARGKPFQVTTLIAGKEVVRIGSHDLNTSCVERWVLEDLERFSPSVVTRPFKDSLSLTHCAHGWCAVVAQVSCSTIKHNEFGGPLTSLKRKEARACRWSLQRVFRNRRGGYFQSATQNSESGGSRRCFILVHVDEETRSKRYRFNTCWSPEEVIHSEERLGFFSTSDSLLWGPSKLRYFETEVAGKGRSSRRLRHRSEPRMSTELISLSASVVFALLARSPSVGKSANPPSGRLQPIPRQFASPDCVDEMKTGVQLCTSRI